MASTSHWKEKFRRILYVFSLVHFLTKDYGPLSVKIIRHLLWYCWPVHTQSPFKCGTSVANLALKSIWVSRIIFPKVPAPLLPSKLGISLTGWGRGLFLQGDPLTSAESGSTQTAVGANASFHRDLFKEPCFSGRGQCLKSVQPNWREMCWICCSSSSNSL